MAEPFVFNFKPGPLDEPLQMYIADVRGRCELCGALQIQRFYHTYPFHTLTVRKLERLVDDGATKLDIDCKNCGEHVDATMTTDVSLTWAFADDSGVFTAWRTEDAPRWVITPHVRLDPQALPGFDIPPHAEPLSEEEIERLCGRPLNPKNVWLDLFSDLESEPDSTFFDDISRGFRAAVSSVSHEELLDTFDAKEDRHVVAWNPSELGLPFHESIVDIFAAPLSWVSQETLARLQSGEWFAGAEVGIEPIKEQIERAFSVANISYEFDARSSAFTKIVTPTELAFGKDVSTVAIARRAVYTGMTPGDAARLTAEEVVGTLLRVWSS